MTAPIWLIQLTLLNTLKYTLPTSTRSTPFPPHYLMNIEINIRNKSDLPPIILLYREILGPNIDDKKGL